MRNACIKALFEMAEKHSEMVVMVGDNGTIVFDEFRRQYPTQFLNSGIAEANMISTAAGMASCGIIPVTYTIIPFLVMRAYEQIRNDVCLQKQNVKLFGIGAGCSYSALGPTHHAIEDISVLRVLPGMTIISPASPLEAYQATKIAVELAGPVYLRLGTGREAQICPDGYEFLLGKAQIMREGTDVAVFATGSILGDVLDVATSLSAEGVSVEVINVSTIKPFDTDSVIRAAKKVRAILSVEEHSVLGGLGSIISEVIAEKRLQVSFKRFGLQDSFCQGYGDHSYVKEINELSKRDMKGSILQLLACEKN